MKILHAFTLFFDDLSILAEKAKGGSEKSNNFRVKYKVIEAE